MQVNGSAIMSKCVAAWALLGLPAVVGKKPYSLRAVVDRDGEVYKIPRSDFNQMITQNSCLCADALRILACEVHPRE